MIISSLLGTLRGQNIHHGGREKRSGDRVIARDRVIGRTKTDSGWSVGKIAKIEKPTTDGDTDDSKL